VIADRGYRGDARIITPERSKNANHYRAMNTAVLTRHETINDRLKTWGILKQVFCHGRDKHHVASRYVLVLTEIAIENGSPPFQVGNLDNPLRF
jgi:hypothetical protein